MGSSIARDLNNEFLHVFTAPGLPKSPDSRVMWLGYSDGKGDQSGLILDCGKDSSFEDTTSLRVEAFSRITSPKGISAWHPFPGFPGFPGSDPIAPTLPARYSHEPRGSDAF